MDITDNYFENLANDVDTVKSNVNAFTNATQQDLRAVAKNKQTIPEILNGFLPYMVDAIIPSTLEAEIKVEYLFTQAALEKSELIFGEIAYQLASNSAKGIDLLGNRSQLISKDFGSVSETVRGFAGN